MGPPSSFSTNKQLLPEKHTRCHEKEGCLKHPGSICLLFLDTVDGTRSSKYKGGLFTTLDAFTPADLDLGSDHRTKIIHCCILVLVKQGHTKPMSADVSEHRLTLELPHICQCLS